MKPLANALPTKHHYQILDGLRGVAAITVVIFHICEAYANNNPFQLPIGHGYLAVDFFFLLSGFVVAYAYDDRWSRMTLRDFFTRRLIRLQPMVVLGTLIGAALFYPQHGSIFPLIAGTPLWKMLLVMLVGFTMLPLTPALDIRGWQETHPLNGPAWSLLYEYIANILYALGLRKLSKRWLSLLVFLSALFLLHREFTSSTGDVIGGWAFDATNIHIGFVRLLYPFLAGMLLMRLGKRVRIPAAFAVSSGLLVLTLVLPRPGRTGHPWPNAFYESLCILIVFPLVVAIGAGGSPGPLGTRLARLLGEISYPLYITHYPLIYLYTVWVVDKKVPATTGALAGAALLLTAVAIAYASLKLYDEPVRRWLSRRLL